MFKHLALVILFVVAAPLSAVAGNYYYARTYGWGPSTNLGYNGYASTDLPHRGTWQTRYNKWVQQELAYQNAAQNAPCGTYLRAPAGCYRATTPYIPALHGDR